jgi:hypothetical protein
MKKESLLLIALISVLIISGCSTTPQNDMVTKECLTNPDEYDRPVNLLRYVGCEDSADCRFVLEELIGPGISLDDLYCGDTSYETIIYNGDSISCTRNEDCYDELNIPTEISGNIPQKPEANARYSESWKKLFICQNGVCKTTTGINSIFKIQSGL